MHVLEDHQYRLGLRQRLQLRGECLQRLLSPLLRGQFQRWITSVVWQRQHFSKQRGILAVA